MKVSAKMTLIAVAVGLSISPSVLSQEQQEAKSDLGFERIIVTGTSRPKEKIESTNAITTFN